MSPNPWRDLRGWQERLEQLTGHHGDAWVPPIDVFETADRYVIAAELPGLVRDQIELAMEDSKLTIRGRTAGAVYCGSAARSARPYRDCRGRGQCRHQHLLHADRAVAVRRRSFFP